MIPHSNTEVQVGNLEDSDWQMPNREGRARPRVWLVDDSHEFRRLLAVILAHEGGFDCSREFSSGHAVLAALAVEAPPDVILLDVQMGEECGLDVIQPIKSIATSTHVIMLTTCFDSLYRARAQRSGATDFLLKSYSAEEIARRVWQAMEQPVPSAEVLVEVSSKRKGQRATESVNGRFNNHDLSRHRFANWKTAPSRILRGAFYVRSLLTMFF